MVALLSGAQLLLLNPIASPSSPPHGWLSPPFGGSRLFWRCPPPSCWPPPAHPAGCFWHPHQQWHFKPPPPLSRFSARLSSLPSCTGPAHFFDNLHSTALQPTISTCDMAQVHIVFGQLVKISESHKQAEAKQSVGWLVREKVSSHVLTGRRPAED